MMGININCKGQDFIEQILSYQKKIETRNTPSLHPYLGQRVGLVRTGKGKAMLMGYADILWECEYNTEEEFRKHEHLHLVSKGSKFDIKDKKYGYILTNIERCEPTPVTSRGIVARRIESPTKLWG